MDEVTTYTKTHTRRATRMTGLDCVVVCNSTKYIQTQHGEEDMSMLGYADARRLVLRDAGSTEPIPLR